MFRVAIGLLVVALIAAVFGFGGIASTAADFAKIVFVVALVLAVLGFIFGRTSAVGLVLAAGLGGLLAAGSARAESTSTADAEPSPAPVTSTVSLPLAQAS